MCTIMVHPEAKKLPSEYDWKLSHMLAKEPLHNHSEDRGGHWAVITTQPFTSTAVFLTPLTEV